MAASFNPDNPKPPAIARILAFMGWISIIGVASGVMLAFSGYPWVNELYALVGSAGALILGVLFIGQAKMLEGLSVLNARMKSRFALENIGASAALGEAVPKRPPIIPQKKERVVKISETEARSSGVRTR